MYGEWLTYASLNNFTRVDPGIYSEFKKKEKEKGEKSLVQIIAFSINNTFIDISSNIYALKTEANNLGKQYK